MHTSKLAAAKRIRCEATHERCATTGGGGWMKAVKGAGNDFGGFITLLGV
jgi:hypothetical protein